MYSEYQTLYSDYSKQYGRKTAIFMAVGSFYEIYGIQDPETGDINNNAREIADFLGLQLSVKKGDVPDGKDGLFSGFPDYALHKWAARLTANGWTVVVVDQVKSATGKVLRREVSRILSPSTHIEAMPSTETPYLTTIYFQEATTTPPSFGVATLDLTTGTTLTYTGLAAGRPDVWTVDDLVQFLSVHPPKEVVCHYLSSFQPDATNLKRCLSLNPTTPFHLKLASSSDFSKAITREEYFRKVYNIKSMLPPKEFLGLRTPQEELSLLYLLQFTETHNPSALQRFHRNQPWVPQLQLICGNHAISQLQLDVVANIFNQCITPMGKRDINQRLLKPLSQVSQINARLLEVNSFLSWPDSLKKSLDKQLRFLFDIPRLHRKVLTATIAQGEFSQLYQSYEAIEKIISEVVSGTVLAAPFSITEWNNYRHQFNKYIDATKALQVSEDQTPFSTITFPEIKETETAIIDIISEFNKFKIDLAKAAGFSADSLRLETREKEPFGLKGSSSQLKILASIKNMLPFGLVIKELKSGGWIEHPILDNLNIQLIKLRDQLASRARKALLDTCQNISDSGTNIWSQVEEWISHVDCTQCIAKVSRERGFVMPEIIDDSSAAVSIKGLRHPLVEEGRVAYVQHNIELGKKTDGYLVYGMNASGKSTLMKAVGLSVLLAQAGCFVPAREMKLTPFRAIYTRILNQDNIFAGLSSFAVEMSELRDILRAADNWSLVLGDELCAGTESISAQALVASGIQWLANRNTKYIFATHLHELPQILDIDLLKLQVWHLHVEHDPKTGKLIYDRSLRPGSGSTLYGLEVAKALDLPFEFLETAHANRRKILGTRAEAEVKTSTWNKELDIKRCEMCGKEGKDLEVHHIQQRASADPIGILPDGTPMNLLSNLAVLCEECHDKHHAGKIEVKPLIQTSEGPIRDTIVVPEEKPKSPKNKSNKWTEEEQTTIKDILVKYKTASLKTIKFQLEKDYGIDISESSLRGIKGRA